VLNPAAAAAEKALSKSLERARRRPFPAADGAINRSGAPMTTLEARPPASPAGVLPLPAAAELQDHLLVAGNDLDRLQRLLDGACAALTERFTAAAVHVDCALDAGAASEALHDARAALGGTVTALQFQDMASQLIEHTARRLRYCADRLASDAFGDDEDGAALVEPAPLRPNPVTQDEMDAGSVDLF
jgi:hypothetical protein